MDTRLTVRDIEVGNYLASKDSPLESGYVVGIDYVGDNGRPYVLIRVPFNRANPLVRVYESDLPNFTVRRQSDDDE